MTYNENCKTCNLDKELLSIINGMYQSGNGYKTISRALFETYDVNVSRESIRNHFNKHYSLADDTTFDGSYSATNVDKVATITPGFEIDENGRGYIQTPLIESSDLISNFSDILRDMGLDPDEFIVVGKARVSKWQQSEDGKYLSSYRVNIEKKSTLDEQISDILPAIQTYEPKVPDPKETQDHAFVFVAGDLQLGKSDADGTEGIVTRYRESLQKAVDKLNSLDHMVSEVLISWVGDCIEGMVSQGGRNARRTELTTTQQVRLLRKLMTETVLAFSSLSPKITVVSVPGNHDEAQRQPVSTDPSDSWAVDALVSVSEAFKLAGDKYDHIKFEVVPFDEMTLTVEVAGTKIGHAHGHQWSRGKHFDWWSGQHWGGHEVGYADILLAGHFHTGLYEQENKKYFIRVPSMEEESTYFRHRTGKIGNPSAVTFLTKNAIIKFMDFE